MVKEATRTTTAQSPTGIHVANLNIEGYRGIRDLEIPRLGQVNLFAGENGCGKSSLLEAIVWMAAHQGVEHSHDHLHVESIARDEPEIDFYKDSPSKLGESIDSLGQHYIEGTKIEYVGKDRPHFSRKHDELFHHSEHGISPPRSDDANEFHPSVIRAGQIAEPDLADIRYELVSQRGTGLRHDCLMAVMRNGDSFPIAGLGAGARHMMAIMSALANAPTKEGVKPVFLVDEIDEGLHRRIHVDFWRLLISEAIDRVVQIFATTHSLDCVKGFAYAGREYPERSAWFFRLEKEKDSEHPSNGKTYAVGYSPGVLLSSIENSFDPR